MARGTMYELQREKDFLNQLQEEELYEHLPDIAEFVKTEKNKEGAVCILLEEMQELGAVVGKEDDIPYIIFTKECKENYFRDRFAKVKKMVADMDLDEFSNSDLFTLRDTIQDNWGDMAYEDSMIPFAASRSYRYGLYQTARKSRYNQNIYGWRLSRNR